MLKALNAWSLAAYKAAKKVYEEKAPDCRPAAVMEIRFIPLCLRSTRWLEGGTNTVYRDFNYILSKTDRTILRDYYAYNRLRDQLRQKMNALDYTVNRSIGNYSEKAPDRDLYNNQPGGGCFDLTDIIHETDQTTVVDYLYRINLVIQADGNPGLDRILMDSALIAFKQECDRKTQLDGFPVKLRIITPDQAPKEMQTNIEQQIVTFPLMQV